MEMSRHLNLEPIRQPSKADIIIQLIDKALAELTIDVASNEA